jgi:hypothetical protein
LFSAVASGNVERVRELLASDPSAAKMKDGEGVTPACNETAVIFCAWNDLAELRRLAATLTARLGPGQTLQPTPLLLPIASGERRIVLGRRGRAVALGPGHAASCPPVEPGSKGPEASEPTRAQ